MQQRQYKQQYAHHRLHPQIQHCTQARLHQYELSINSGDAEKL